MHTLFYCSVATREMLDSDILDILKVSIKNNEQNNITGILAYQKETREFFQILEGEKEVIFKLLDTITKDDRNISVDLVYDSDILERNFKGWSMAFADLDSVDSKNLEGYSNFLKKGFTTELTVKNEKYAYDIVKMFQHYLT